MRLGFVCATLVMAVSAASADTIYASATMGPGSLSGSVVSSTQFLGARFEVTSTVTTTAIGGHFFGVSPTFTHAPSNIFGAVVALTGFNDDPDSTDLSTSDVLGTAVISIPGVSNDASAPISLTLTPGVYALVYGSGKFGATGMGSATGNNTPIGPQSIFFSTGSGWQDSSSSGERFFLEGTAPEPATLALLGVGLGLIAWRRRRRS